MTRAERMTPAEWHDIARDLVPQVTERQLDALWSALRWHTPDVVRTIGERLGPGERLPWPWAQAAGREQGSRDASQHAHQPRGCQHGHPDAPAARCPQCRPERAARASAGAARVRAALASAREATKVKEGAAP